MKLLEVIDQLKRQRELIDQAITLLKQIDEQSSPIKTPIEKRGRKFMSEKDRHGVSERMREYWAKPKNGGSAGREHVTGIRRRILAIFGVNKRVILKT